MPDDSLAFSLPRPELDNGKAISLKALVRQANKLCPMSDVVQRLMQLLDDPRCNATRVARVLERDQTLCAQLLKVCNSGLYGGVVSVVDVRGAVTRIGLRAVRDLALASSVLSGSKVATDVVSALRRQMVTAAGCTRVVAGYLHQVPLPSAFLTGMLLDVGRLIFAVAVPLRYGELAAQASLGEIPIQELESAWVGFTHADLGAAVARLWRFPDGVIYAIEHRHHLAALAGDDPTRDLTACAAALGAHLAAVLHDELAPDQASAEVLATHPAQQRLGLDGIVLDALYEECERARFENGSFFEV